MMDMFCVAKVCAHGGLCGNALRESDALQITRCTRPGELTLTATKAIDAGVILGEYLGEVKVEAIRKKDKQNNNGYIMQLCESCETHPKSRVIIEASRYGSMMRFLNHSCMPTARFHEVTDGRHRTVVAISCRAISAGEEVTVDYSRTLWFLCKCGEDVYVHRHLRSSQ
jgi:SET domain-containing protein